MAAAVALVPLLLFFAAYTAAVTQNAFLWTGQPPKIAPFLLGIWTSSITWVLGPTRFYPPIAFLIRSCTVGATWRTELNDSTPPFCPVHLDSS